MKKVVQETKTSVAPERKELPGLLRTGSAMSGSSINHKCRNRLFKLPHLGNSVLARGKALPAAVDSSGIGPQAGRLLAVALAEALAVMRRSPQTSHRARQAHTSMTPGLSQHAPDGDTPGSQRQSWEPGLGTPGKMPSRCLAVQPRASLPPPTAKVKFSKFGSRRKAGVSGPTVCPLELRRPECPVSSSRFRRVWTRWPRAAVRSAAGYTPWEGVSGRDLSRAPEWGRERKEEKGAPGFAPAGDPRAAQVRGGACDSEAPAGCGRLGIPGLQGRGQRSARSRAPAGGARVQQADAHGPGPGQSSRACGREARGGPGAGGACSPAGPPSAARPPAKPGPAPALGLSRNNLL